MNSKHKRHPGYEGKEITKGRKKSHSSLKGKHPHIPVSSISYHVTGKYSY